MYSKAIVLKKGMIEFSQGAVLYIIIMVVVIFIGLLIVTQGNVLILFEQGAFSKMFEPGSLKTQTEKSQIEVTCNDALQLSRIVITNVGFTYGGGGDKEIRFAVILDTRNGVTVGEALDESGVGTGNHYFTCTPPEQSSQPFNCGTSKNIEFTLPFTAGEDEYFHATIWQVDDESETETLAERTFSEIAENSFRKYLGSFDIGAHDIGKYTFGFNCLAKECDKCNSKFIPCNEIECHESREGCWYNKQHASGYGACTPCLKLSSCSSYRTLNQCVICGAYSRLNSNRGCQWLANKCSDM